MKYEYDVSSSRDVYLWTVNLKGSHQNPMGAFVYQNNINITGEEYKMPLLFLRSA